MASRYIVLHPRTGGLQQITKTHRAYDALDNRKIVPYNRFLLLKFTAHINVEIYSTVNSVKYLYKYVYQGHDRAVVDLNQVVRL